MNRMDEYTALLAELEQVPKELDNTVNKALNRKNTSQKKRHFFGVSLGGLAACFAAFVLLVNLSTPFARACGRIPLLADLAKAVSWSPSLSAAVENDYVQPLRLSQSQNGITARVEYLIVDRKQVDVFFSVQSDDYAHLDLDHPTLTVPGEQEGYASSFSSYGIENGDLMELRIDFMDRDVPDCLTMTFGVYDNKHLYENQKPTAQSNVADYGDELLSDNPREQREILATFTFELHFDPTYTEQGTVIDVGETFLLDGQSVTLTEAEIYPTHLRLNFDYDPANTAWLTELNFYLENERGERFNGIVNGISATGNPDDPSTDSVWLDSPYFSTGEHLTLHVTGASWIDKGQERVKVDLAKGMIEDPPQGVRLEWAEKREAGWVVSFSAGARWEKTMHYQIWKSCFYDEDGTAHDIDQRGVSDSPMILGEISGAELESYEAAEKAAKGEKGEEKRAASLSAGLLARLQDVADAAVGNAVFPGELPQVGAVVFPQDGLVPQRTLQRFPLGEINAFPARRVQDLEKPLHAHQLAEPLDLRRDLLLCQMKLHKSLPFYPFYRTSFIVW